MGLLDRFKKHESEYDAHFRKMGIEFLDLYIIEENFPFESLSEPERHILTVYFLGMAEGLEKKLMCEHNAEEMSHAIINCLIRVFKYSEEQAQKFFELTMDELPFKDNENTETSETVEYTDCSVINRGREGYRAWETGHKTAVIDDVYEIIKALEN